jgi:polar amino acid transport system substrate-binding protein
MDKDCIRLLLVEDSPSDAQLLCESLQRFEIARVERLDEAIALLGRKSFDVILLDLNLPDSTGLETCKRIAPAAGRAPIIVLTGADDEAIAIEAMHLGVQDYLVKGQMPAGVIARAIQYAVERDQIRQSLREARDELEVRVQERTAELQRAMNLVQSERQRFLNVLDQLPAYLILLSPDHRVPFANRFFEERFGKSEGRRCFEYLFGRTEPCEKCDTYKVLEEGCPQRWEWTGPDGRNYDIYDFPFTDVDGSPLIMEVGLDVTERKRAEGELAKHREHLEELVKERTGQLEIANARLAESEQRVRRKLESVLSPEGDLRVLDLADLIDAPALQKLMDDFYAVAHVPMAIIDLKGRALVGVGWQDICTRFHRVHAQTCQYCIRNDTQLTDDLAQGESRLYKCKNNLWDMATPIFVAGQRVGNAFTGQFFFEDETVDREYFREQARKYGFDETGYLAALDRVPRLSREMINRGIAFLRGLADMLSQLGHSNIKLARLLAERDRLTDSLRELNATLESKVAERTAELEQRARQLEEAWAKVRSESEARIAALEQLRHEDRLKIVGRLASGIAHELGTPLNVISGYAGMIAGGSLSPHDTTESARTIKAQSERIASIVRQILDFARRRPGQRIAVDLQQLARQTLDLATPLAQKRNVNLILTDGNDAAVVKADVEQVRQVLLNLITNAVQAMHRSGNVEVAIGPARAPLAADRGDPDKYVCISVLDEGEGIPEENLGRIFDPFFTTKGPGKGTGLGLAITEGIVREHGGWITVESTVGKGSRFCVYLPKEDRTCRNES